MFEMTVDFLVTTLGMAVAVSLIVQTVKGVFAKVDPKIISLIASLTVAYIVQLVFKHDYSAQGYVLSAVNALVVHFAAVGSYENIIKTVINTDIVKSILDKLNKSE
jgi:hypothetical protein